jgi:putative transposase
VSATAIDVFMCCASWGWQINQNKTRRIYRELGLQLRNKTPKRRVKAKLREDRRKGRTRPGRWTLCIISSRPDRSFAC